MDSATLYDRTANSLPHVDPEGRLAPPGMGLVINDYVEWVDDLANTIRLELEN